MPENLKRRDFAKTSILTYFAGAVSSYLLNNKPSEIKHVFTPPDISEVSDVFEKLCGENTFTLDEKAARIAVTKEGKIGLISTSVQEGDEVCVFASQRVPMCIRAQNVSKRTYTLSGWAYIYGKIPSVLPDRLILHLTTHRYNERRSYLYSSWRRRHKSQEAFVPQNKTTTTHVQSSRKEATQQRFQRYNPGVKSNSSGNYIVLRSWTLNRTRV